MAKNPKRVLEGDQLKVALQKRDVTYPELARGIKTVTDEVTRDMVAQMAGGVTRINDERKARIAAFLRMSVDEIWSPSAVGEFKITGTASGEVTPASEQPEFTVVNDPKLVEGFANTVAVRTWESAEASTAINTGDCDFVQAELPAEVLLAFIVGGVKNLDFHDLVKVRGGSMLPLINPSDRVLFFNDGTLKPNTIVMAQDPEGHMKIKALRFKNGLFVLESLAKDGLNFSDLTGWQIFGHAVLVMGDPDGSVRNLLWPFGAPIKV